MQPRRLTWTTWVLPCEPWAACCCNCEASAAVASWMAGRRRSAALLPLQAREVPKVEVGGATVEGEHGDVGCVVVLNRSPKAAIQSTAHPHVHRRPAASAAKGLEPDDGRRPVYSCWLPSLHQQSARTYDSRLAQSIASIERC